MWAWTAIPAVAQVACDPADAVSSGLKALLAGRSGDARAALDAAEEGLGCGPPVDPETLATWWIVDSLLLAGEGDPASGEDSLASAARVVSGAWPAAIPDDLRGAYDAVAPLQGQGVVELTPPQGAREVWIDGRRVASNRAATGLHAIQVGDGHGKPAFGVTVWVDPGVTRVVPVPLDALTEEDPHPPSRPIPVAFTVLGGVDVARGLPLAGDVDGTVRIEPQLRVSVPIEASAAWSSDGAWVRAGVGIAPLLGGRLLYQRASDGDVVAMAAHLDATAAAGIPIRSARAGIAAGVQWPARLAARGLVGWSAEEGPWTGEIRVGANLPTSGRAPEPAAELLVGVKLP